MDIYTNNAFRMLGLPVTASNREIVQRVEELQTFIAIGQVPVYDYDLPWISKINRNENNIKRAVQTLEKTRSRLRHILSWFWIIDKYDKQALDALKKQNVDSAISIWTAAIKDNSNIYYQKNLAILEHILCLGKINSNSDHLYKSIEYWSNFASYEHLPHMINNLSINKSRDIGDAEIIDVMCEIISAPTNTFLNKWVNDNDLEQIKQFFETVDESSLPVNIINYIKEKYERPLLEKVDTVCDELSSLSCKNDYEKLYDQTLSFYEKVKPYYDQLIQSGDIYLNETYGDKIGQIILYNAISYGNETKQWKKSKSLLEMAKSVTKGFLLKDKLEKNMQIISENALFENVKPIDSAPSFGGSFFGLGTALYGNTNYDGISKSYETTKYFVILGVPILPLSRYRVIKSSDNYYSFLGKVPFRHFDKWHLVAGIIGIILFFAYFIVYPEMQSNKYSSDNKVKTVPKTSSKSNNNSRSKKINSRASEIKLLAIKIDNAEAQLKQKGSEMSQLEMSLENYENRVKVLKEKLENTKLNEGLGNYIDENEYNRNIDEYNSIVNKYNLMLLKIRIKYDDYNDLLEATKAEVNRYNSLVRSNY